MNDIHIGTEQAHVGGGITNAKFLFELAKMKYKVVTGTCAVVGFAGLSLGGGLSTQMREHGLAADNIDAMTVVVANGDIVTASRTSHPDLYWALRGGGNNNYGVVTQFTVRIYTTAGQQYQVRDIDVPREDAVKGILEWQRWKETLPNRAFTQLSINTAGLRTNYNIALTLTGSQAEMDTLTNDFNLTSAVVRADANPTCTGTNMTWIESAICYAWCGFNERSPGARSRMAFEDLSETDIMGLIDAFDTIHSSPCTFSNADILLDGLGGQVKVPTVDYNAFPHRKARYSLQYNVYWIAANANTANARACTNWLKSVHAGKHGLSDFAYRNYIAVGSSGNQESHYGANYARLQAVKDIYDPNNVFKFPIGVNPTAH